ncbi:hypothetical protein P025_gp43 [Pelagibacter phage HTVC025P]|uniref:Glycine-rich domain-containing protein n=1 Tax=Pelagibacter phage HTVC025P TaxID=2259657 RepID=A0A4Y1NU64_9CAUD|nr:hypothetical protein P025_gp43 [Pelagibacter phage HTVC025P]
MTKARDLSKLLSTANGKIAGANLDVSFENITDTGTEGTKVASGTTAQRGSTTGQLRFNSDTGLAEYYDGTVFKAIDSPPSVLSINPTSLGQSVLGSSQSIVITGSGFSNTVTVTITGNDGTTYTPASTTRNSVTQITITTPTNLTHTNEPYSFKVENSSGLSANLANVLSINDTPVFATASGSLGTLTHANRASSNLTAISFSDEESTPTVSVTSGSLPSGVTLNSNGTFSGTANAVGSDTTSNFTVTATDGSETATRNYSITVQSPPTADFLVIAGGAGGGTNGGGGGAGGYRNSYNSETSGRNSASESSLTLTSGQTYTITVGGGGAGRAYLNTANDGSSSSISGYGITTITSIGGGGGGSQTAGRNGGSGGGGGYPSFVGGSGTSNQGFNGGQSFNQGQNYGGGGGSGGVGGYGQDGGNGGNGLASSITGSSVTRAGGGGGGRQNTGTAGSGGTGGAGAGNVIEQVAFNASPANRGSGGGGSGGGSGFSGSGSSGVVILRLATSKYSGTTSGSPTVSTSGTDTILTFNSSGSYTA